LNSAARLNRHFKEFPAMSQRVVTASHWMLGALKKVAIALWRAA
jgi:hypothetical protein